MIDEHIRKVLAIDVTGSIRFEHVIEVLIRLVRERGAPKAMRSDNERPGVRIDLAAAMGQRPWAADGAVAAGQAAAERHR